MPTLDLAALFGGVTPPPESDALALDRFETVKLAAQRLATTVFHTTPAGLNRDAALAYVMHAFEEAVAGIKAAPIRVTVLSGTGQEFQPPPATS